MFYKVLRLEFRSRGLGQRKHFVKRKFLFLNLLIPYELSSKWQEQAARRVIYQMLLLKNVSRQESVFISKMSRLIFHLLSTFLPFIHLLVVGYFAEELQVGVFALLKCRPEPINNSVCC